MLQYGKDAAALEALARAGKEVPALDRRGDIREFLWLWEAYLELNTCRQYASRVPPSIPWTAINAYIQANQFNADEAYLVHRIVRHLDSITQDHYTRQAAVEDRKMRQSSRRRKHGPSR